MSLSKSFYEEMNSIIKKIYKKNEVKEMRKFDKKNPEYIKSGEIIINEMNMEMRAFSKKLNDRILSEEEKEYQEKVEEYT